MNKRKALAGAAAVTLTAVAGALAVGAAFGMVGFSDASSKTGSLSPATKLVEPKAPEPTPIVETIVVDIPAPRTAAGPGASASTGSPTEASEDDPPAPFATQGEPTASPAYSDDDHGGEEDSHADEDDPSATDDHANEDTHEDEDD